MADIVASIKLDYSNYQRAARPVVDANRGVVESQRQIIPATTGPAAGACLALSHLQT